MPEIGKGRWSKLYFMMDMPEMKPLFGLIMMEINKATLERDAWLPAFGWAAEQVMILKSHLYHSQFPLQNNSSTTYMFHVSNSLIYFSLYSFWIISFHLVCLCIWMILPWILLNSDEMNICHTSWLHVLGIHSTPQSFATRKLPWTHDIGSQSI